MNVIVIFFPIELLYSNSVVWQNRIELMYICNTDDQNPSFVTPTGGRTHVLLTSITYIYSKSSYSLHIGLLDA